MPPATSLSDPLIINALPIPGTDGIVGLTFCPGKQHRAASGKDWHRDLNTDLDSIAAFGAKALVTLMKEPELVDVKVPAGQLKSEAARRGLEWVHLPIQDADIPDNRFEDLWTYAGPRLRDRLRRGERIVIHCLGGLGRTGTVGARLLVEFGVAPAAAIQMLRNARPSAIETRSQEQYVAKCNAVAPVPDVRTAEERALGCLLGGAIGDAFGYAVEFSSIAEIRNRFGPSGIEEPVFQNGKLVVSDDTQMTLFTLEGLLRARNTDGSIGSSPIDAIRRAYLDWLDTQDAPFKAQDPTDSTWLASQPVMQARRAPGNTCLGAMRAGGRGTIGNHVNNSKGCGGVMRAAPIGLVRRYTPEHAFSVAAAAAALTHGHPSGYLSAGMLACILRHLMDGSSLDGAIAESYEVLSAQSGCEETIAAVRRAHTAPRLPHVGPANIEAFGGGWVGEEALAIALYAALSAGSFTEVIRIAANHSGDSDSTASIAGQIWGTINGLDGIPADWVYSLDVLLPLLHLNRDFVPSVRAYT